MNTSTKKIYTAALVAAVGLVAITLRTPYLAQAGGEGSNNSSSDTPASSERGGLFGGYRGLGDMVDGGGPGASRQSNSGGRGLFGGYNGLGDMFDGGGPGASGSRSDRAPADPEAGADAWGTYGAGDREERTPGQRSNFDDELLPDPPVIDTLDLIVNAGSSTIETYRDGVKISASVTMQNYVGPANFSGSLPLTLYGKLSHNPQCSRGYSVIDTEEYTFSKVEEGTYVFTIESPYQGDLEGKHCFALLITGEDLFTEQSLMDNRIEFTDVTMDYSRSMYQRPSPPANYDPEQYIEPGSDSPTPPSPPSVPSDDLSTNETVTSDNTIDFRVQVRAADGEVVKNWTEDDVVIGLNDQLSFKWDASAYDQCLPNLKYQSSIFSLGIDIFATTGNTETDNINVREWSDIYSMECTGVNGTHKREIAVTVR